MDWITFLSNNDDIRKYAISQYLNWIDIFMLRLCCKQFRGIFQKHEGKKPFKKVLSLGHYKIAKWIVCNIFSKFVIGEKLVSYFTKKCKDEEEFFAQIYLIEKYLEPSKNTKTNLYNSSVINDNLDLIKWAVRNKYSWGEMFCSDVARHGNLKIFKWCLKNGCKFPDSSIYMAAAEKGHLHIIKYCRKYGIEWDDDYNILTAAAEHDQFEVLKWLIENGCPYNLDDIVKIGNINSKRSVEYVRNNWMGPAAARKSW